LTLVWMTVWGLANLAWLHQDLLPRDGDEEGHVGAAELFREDLRAHDLVGFLHRLWVGDMGDYPSLYPAVTGAWWWTTGVGEPGVPQVRALGLLWVLVAALGTAAIARRSGRPGAPLLAFVTVTLLPLPVGLGRHLMPEGMLVAATVLAVLAALRSAEAPSLGRGLVLGLALGAGLLLKQTFVLLAGPGVLAALVLGSTTSAPAARARALGAALLGCCLLAGPWYLLHLRAQLAYGSDSAAHPGAASLLAHLAWHPVALVLLVVGPPLSALAALGLALALRAGGPGRQVALLAGAWLLGCLLLLTAIPKKYPRLLAPVAPAAALLVAAGLSERRLLSGSAVLLLGGGWLGWRSTHAPLDLPRSLQRVVPGCPQHWLRPPVDDDLGLAAVAARVREAGPGPVRVIGGPDIPCALQTTAPWAEQLSPYLRRTGDDREVLLGPGPQPAALTLRWEADGLPSTAQAEPGAPLLAVPLLRGHFRLERGP